MLLAPLPRGALFAALALLVGACAGDQTVLLPPQGPAEAEAAVPRLASPLDRAAEAEHRRLLTAFGGEYRSAGLKRQLDAILARLLATGETGGARYEVTILNSPIVNAFALPNGRLYVTRGLLALAGDTAEIASVLAHEIAHVTARHAVERAELELRSALVGQVVSQVLNDPVAGAAVQTGSRLSLARFSRQQELDADQISVRAVARAGFDPYGAGRFLVALGRATGFRAILQGTRAGGQRMDILSTHPSTPERIAAVTGAARQIGAPGLGERGGDAWLAAIDGLAYGEDPADGLVAGRRYLNTSLRIGFSAPEGFDLEAARDMVIGVSADGQQALRFDSVALKPGQTLESYVASGWIEGVATGPVEAATAGGLPAALTAGRGTDWSFRLAAIQSGASVYRFILASRGAADPEPGMRAVLASFRALSVAEAQGARPARIDTVVAGAGDTAAELAGRMAVSDRSLDQFLILNGLDRGNRIVPGQRYKLIVR